MNYGFLDNSIFYLSGNNGGIIDRYSLRTGLGYGLFKFLTIQAKFLTYRFLGEDENYHYTKEIQNIGLNINFIISYSKKFYSFIRIYPYLKEEKELYETLAWEIINLNIGYLILDNEKIRWTFELLMHYIILEVGIRFYSGFNYNISQKLLLTTDFIYYIEERGTYGGGGGAMSSISFSFTILYKIYKNIYIAMGPCIQSDMDQKNEYKFMLTVGGN
ncbi:hypothetical protein KAU32_00035 [bacterium]|nr:hypothetical protein [bacterium]